MYNELKNFFFQKPISEINLIEKEEIKQDVNTKSVYEVIEEIHETFYTEVDRLLEEAGIKHSLETNKKDVLDKGIRLKQLGFDKAKSVSEAEEEQERLNDLKKDNDRKVDLIEAINYFSIKYPQYKFITEDSVKKICKKYGLIYGSVSDYKGNVPEKNLIDIENFNIEDIDKCWESMYYRNFSFERNYVLYGNEEDLKILWNKRDCFKPNMCSLEIVAPISDFDLNNKEVKNFKLQNIPDPIVLQPIAFRNKKHYLIITAWGLEIEDDLIKL